jgi:hypothetical protein
MNDAQPLLLFKSRKSDRGTDLGPTLTPEVTAADKLVKTNAYHFFGQFAAFLKAPPHRSAAVSSVYFEIGYCLGTKSCPCQATQ